MEEKKPTRHVTRPERLPTHTSAQFGKVSAMVRIPQGIELTGKEKAVLLQMNRTERRKAVRRLVKAKRQNPKASPAKSGLTEQDGLVASGLVHVYPDAYEDDTDG